MVMLGIPFLGYNQPRAVTLTPDNGFPRSSVKCRAAPWRKKSRILSSRVIVMPDDRDRDEVTRPVTSMNPEFF